MENALFTGMFAAMSAAKNLDVIANNLANITTTAFKKSSVTFQDTMYHTSYDVLRPPVESLQEKELFPEAKTVARVRISQEYRDDTQGSFRVTNNPFDFAINGKGYFQIETPQGIRYTRAGTFTQNNAGELVTQEGYAVLGKFGRIRIPEGVKNIVADKEGNITADDTIIEKITLVDLPEQSLKQVGNNLYGSVAEARILKEQNIQQGALEQSNVNAISEMVNMITLHRTFEAYSKIMQTSESIERICINQVAKAV